MNNDYRENAAPPVDETEIAKEKLRQAGETKRKLIEEREETKRHSMTDNGNYAHNFTRLFATIVMLAAIGGGTCVGVQAFEVKKIQVTPVPDGLCRDELLAFGATGIAMRCNHPAQVAEPRGDNRLFCKCSTAPMPSASAP